ncbi:MAG: hypothetical protein WBY94_29100, partial [Polyangiaceae bacterium]
SIGAMVVRAALFASLVLALWTIGRPAFAMPAGVCDDRGATAIAPAPPLEAPDVAIRQVRQGASCADQDLAGSERVVPAHRVFPLAYGAAHHALSAMALPLALDVGVKLRFWTFLNRPLAGVRCRVERPPRV